MGYRIEHENPKLCVVGNIATYKGLGYEIKICGDQTEIIWNANYMAQHNCENECFQSAFIMLYQMKKLIK